MHCSSFLYHLPERQMLKNIQQEIALFSCYISVISFETHVLTCSAQLIKPDGSISSVDTIHCNWPWRLCPHHPFVLSHPCRFTFIITIVLYFFFSHYERNQCIHLENVKPCHLFSLMKAVSESHLPYCNSSKAGSQCCDQTSVKKMFAKVLYTHTVRLPLEVL